MKIHNVERSEPLAELTTAATPRQTAWRLALTALGLCLALMLGLYWQTAESMARIWWRSDTFAHGMLIVPIVLYMVWVKRPTLGVMQPNIQPWGLGLLGVTVLGWFAAHVADVMVVQQLALVSMIPALALTLLGRRVAWTLAFPLGYLFFAVPIGEDLVPPLQDFTAYFTVKSLRLTGIPVFWEGRLLSIPSGDFEVAEACSGLRYLIASLALGCLYAYLTYRSLWRRLAFIALAIVAPIIANGFRAYGIVMLAHLSDRRLAVGVDHLIYGWLFFGLVIMLMFWIGSFWREDPHDQPVVDAEPADHPVPTATWRGFQLTAGLAVLVLVSGPLAAHLLLGAAPGGVAALPAPVATGAWSGPLEPPADGWTPQFLGADAELHQVYTLDGRPVHLYLAYYREQRQGAELVNSSNSLYDGQRWIYGGQDTQMVALEGESRAVRELALISGKQRRLVWSWYRVSGRHTISAVAAKLLEAWDRVIGHRGAAAVVVAADYELRQDEAREVLETFLTTMGPQVLKSLARAEQGP